MRYLIEKINNWLLTVNQICVVISTPAIDLGSLSSDSTGCAKSLATNRVKSHEILVA